MNKSFLKQMLTYINEEEYYLEKQKDGKWYEVIDTSGKRTDEKTGTL